MRQNHFMKTTNPMYLESIKLKLKDTVVRRPIKSTASLITALSGFSFRLFTDKVLKRVYDIRNSKMNFLEKALKLTINISRHS